MKTLTRATLGLVTLVGLAACAGSPMPNYGGGPAAAPATQYGSFESWRNDFRSRALSAGIRADVFDSAFAGISMDNEVVRLDGQQAEFSKQIWEYLDGAVSSDRIGTGRAKSQEWSRTLDGIESRYGVDKRAVLAIWGMETNYGGFMGNKSVIGSLATLAYEGRRRSFAEEQLIAALRILQSGDTSPGNMRGSWAGAMGHTQFMPTSYLTYAQDYYGDGRRDIWDAGNPTDALASTAYYLKQNGWVKGQPWGVEVAVPSGFNYALADEQTKQSVSAWRSLGVTTPSGGSVPDYGTAGMIAPGGANGPKFLVFNNFSVIKTYNNSTSYAMGVGHLGDRIYGGAPFAQSWPRGDAALSRTQKRELQERLTALGYDTGGIDGVTGSKTSDAVRRYQRDNGLVADGYVNAALLNRLR
ncbi:lytic murein transglycosylase [Paracoccaceae bacterium GXU_MW_L88]